MAFGTHWEWRGFGDVSHAFFERYEVLTYQFGPLKGDDLYIWAPGLTANLKIREGYFGGLKFKRRLGKDGRFECWIEHPGDLHDLPLDKAAWQALAVELGSAGLVLGPYPPEPPGHDQLLFLLERAGCRSLLVTKERGGRWWPGPNGRVLVEWTAIHKPQTILSISLESEDLAGEGAGLTDEQAKADLQAAFEALGLDHEPLLPMNYMDAVDIWVGGGVIKPTNAGC
jgi:hypothetical protein